MTQLILLLTWSINNSHSLTHSPHSLTHLTHSPHSLTHSLTPYQGRIQDFKLGGAQLKKIAPSGRRRENFWGISCEKSRFYVKKSYFFQFQGGRAPGAPPPPPGSAPAYSITTILFLLQFVNICGWIVAAVLACLVLYGEHDDLNNGHVSTEVASLYNTVHRTVWGACVCWVVFSCANGYGGR